MTNGAPWPRSVIHILRYAPGRGGTEAHVLHMASEHARMGMKVRVVVSEDPMSDELVGWFRDAGCEITRLDVDSARVGHGGMLARLWKLGQLLRREQPDVTHLHSGGHTGGMPVLIVAQLAVKGVVIHTEHLFPREEQGFRFRLWKRIGDFFSDALITVSRANGDYRRRYSQPPADRFAAVLNGIPLYALDTAEKQAHRSQVRSQWQIPQDALLFGAVSRLVDWKGVDWGIRAFALLPAERNPWLLIVGDGPEKPGLEKLAAELGVAERVRFTGYQSTPLVLIDAMDVFLDAIPLGSGSIALLESMSRGLPPIITATGPEEAVIHEESGLRAPPKDPPGLAAAMERFFDDGYRLEMGRKARAHIERHFSAERVALDTIDVYRAARERKVPARLRADAPVNARPGDGRH